MNKTTYFKSLYSSVRTLDESYLKRKRKKLEKIAEKVIKKREHIVSSINGLDAMEQTYRLHKKQYDKSVSAIQRQLEMRDPERLSVGQDKLNQFRLNQQQMTQETERER